MKTAGSLVHTPQMVISWRIGNITIQPPRNGRIHVVRVVVNERLDWNRAVYRAASEERNCGPIWELGKYYPPGRDIAMEVDLALVNYPDNSKGWDSALAWASRQGLVASTPRQVFAAAEQHPRIHRELGHTYDDVNVVETTGHQVKNLYDQQQESCCVEWRGISHHAERYWGIGRRSPYDWFAFRVPSSSQPCARN